MGISRDSRKKRRHTGGRMPIHQKKRKFEMGRQSSSTKLGERKIVPVRGRGGNIKRRALRLNEGNFKTKMLLQVHDELVFDVYKPELELIKNLVKTEMEQAYLFKVPLEVEMGTGDNWLEAH